MSSLGKSVSDINLGMLYLAREALQEDRVAGMANLGISQEVASLLLSLSAEEINRLARTPLLLVGLRWRSGAVWDCLKQYASGTPNALSRAVILGEEECDHVH